MTEQPTATPTRPRWLFPLIGCGIAGLCMLVAAGALSVYLLLGIGGNNGGSYSETFDAERWRQATIGCDPNNPRLGMYSQLEQKLLRERPTQAEVLALLGATSGNDTSATLTYDLGLNMVDCDYVRISFGSDGRVSEVRYVQG